MLIRIFVAILCLLLVAFAFITRTPLCIDSNLINRFDRVDENLTSSMFRCNLHRQVPFDEKFSEESPLLTKRLRKMNDFFNWTGSLQRSINVTISSQRPLHFRVYDHDIYMGTNLYNMKDQLERAVFKVWLRERINKEFFEHNLLEEVFVDLFLFAAIGNFNEDFFQGKWPRTLQTMNGYCKGDWKFSEHIQFCKQLENSTKTINSQITNLSLRPFLSMAMIAALRKLESSEQFELIKKMSENLNVFNFQNTEAIQTFHNNLGQSYQEAVRFVVDFSTALKNWRPEDVVFVRFFDMFRLVLEENGFLNSGESSTVQIYIFGDGLRTQDLETLNKFVSKNPQQVVVVEQGHNLVMPPNKEPISKKAIGFIRAHKAIWLRCKFPSTKEIIDITPFFQKLLVVDTCANSNKSEVEAKPLDLASFLKGHAIEFASTNKNIPFVHIHTKSFKLAVENKINPYGLSNLRFEKSLNAYRVENIIPSIDYFRGRTH